MATTKIAIAPMKAAQIPKGGADFQIVEREIPAPGVGEVRIKVQACGICHSDVLTKDGLWPGIQYPRVPGHEVAGILDELGAGVSGWTKGQRVGVGWHGGHDGTCLACRRGDFGNCQNMKIAGISYDGGYQQYMVAPVEALTAIPKSLSDTDAAPLLCAGITTFNALRHSGAMPGDLVAVQGIGGLGHLGVQFARKFGYKVAAIGRGSENATLRRINRRASHDRNLSARKSERGLRAHDERQGRVPRRSDDVRLAEATNLRARAARNAAIRAARRTANQVARKRVSDDHNRQEPPLFARSIERHALSDK